MFEQMKRGCVLMSLVVGVFVTGTAFPVLAKTKDSIVGTVSSVDGTALTINMLNDLIEVDAGGAKIRKKGVENATVSDILEGDVVKVKGSVNSSGVIEATSIKDPVKLKKGYEGKLTGKTKSVNTSAKTFKIFGQEIDASGISDINMSGKMISLGNLRSGISVDVYVKAKNKGLAARNIIIRSDSCTYCHGPK